MEKSSLGVRPARPASDREKALRRAPVADKVALVHLGNAGGLGTTRRVAVWQELLAAAGAKTIELNLLADHRRRLPSPLAAAGSLGGRTVPETAMWSPRSAGRTFDAIGPDAVVFVTPRAFHPRLAAMAPWAVLDFQDLFSRSYRGRAQVDERLGVGAAWHALSWATERFERRDHRIATVTAGFSEARAIGAHWIPNTVAVRGADAPISDRAEAPFDLVFFGKLGSLPNVDALRSLSWLWPRLAEEVPGITCLVAGAGVTKEIRSLADSCGWTVEDGFDDVVSLSRRARVAVAPLRYANGIQNKVLEAAAVGLPQVLSAQALAGTAPGFPALVVRTKEAMVAAVRALLAEPRRRVLLATQAQAHVAEHYSGERWAPTVRELVHAPGDAVIPPQPSDDEMAAASVSPASAATSPIGT